jgi:Fic family protein
VFSIILSVQAERYKGSPIGRRVPITVPTPGGVESHVSFVPSPLPAAVRLSDPTHLAVSEADQAMGLLEGAARQLPNRNLLIRPIIRREAVSTSALEGTYTGLSEVLEAEIQEGPSRRPEIREVLNYVRATEYALEQIKNQPISLNLTQQLHRLLIRGTRGDSPDTGRFRTVQVVIGPQGLPIADSHFVPPPPGDEMLQLLEDWGEWNYRTDDLPVVVRTAVSHYQFEVIHPFRDGNGRLGRLLAVLLLIERGPLCGHLLSLSPFLEARRAEYGEHLREVSATGNFDPWVRFFARTVAAQAVAAAARAERLLAFRGTAVHRVRDARIKGLAVSITEDLIGYPVTSVSEIAARYGVSFRAANQAVAKLVDRSLLREATGRGYGRVFVCEEALELLGS